MIRKTLLLALIATFGIISTASAAPLTPTHEVQILQEEETAKCGDGKDTETKKCDDGKDSESTKCGDGKDTDKEK